MTRQDIVELIVQRAVNDNLRLGNIVDVVIEACAKFCEELGYDDRGECAKALRTLITHEAAT